MLLHNREVYERGLLNALDMKYQEQVEKYRYLLLLEKKEKKNKEMRYETAPFFRLYKYSSSNLSARLMTAHIAHVSLRCRCECCTVFFTKASSSKGGGRGLTGICGHLFFFFFLLMHKSVACARSIFALHIVVFVMILRVFLFVSYFLTHVTLLPYERDSSNEHT